LVYNTANSRTEQVVYDEAKTERYHVRPGTRATSITHARLRPNIVRPKPRLRTNIEADGEASLSR